MHITGPVLYFQIWLVSLPNRVMVIHLVFQPAVSGGSFEGGAHINNEGTPPWI